MNRSVSFSAVGHASSIFLAISFLLCVVLDLLVPQYQMHAAWQLALPGFHWLSLPSFLLGLAESYAYGWYFTLIWVPIYNVMAARSPAV